MAQSILTLLERKKWNSYQKDTLVSGLSKYGHYFWLLKHDISNRVRSQVSFSIVMNTLKFLPLCSTMFEDMYHTPGYFSDDYKQWVMTNFPQKMLGHALNKLYVLNWMVKNCKVKRCIALFTPSPDLVTRCIALNRLRSANQLLEQYGKKVVPPNFLQSIFNTQNLGFITHNLKYCVSSLEKNVLCPLIEKSSREIFEYFLEYSPCLSYTNQIQMAIETCDLDYLNDIFSKGMLTFTSVLCNPQHANEHIVLDILKFLKVHNHPIFDGVNNYIVPNVQSSLIADFLYSHKVDFRAGRLWAKTEDCINWYLLNHKQESIDWIAFTCRNSLSTIVDCFEKYQTQCIEENTENYNLQKYVNYIQEQEVVGCLDISLLHRLYHLGFDFTRLMYHTLVYFPPSLVFLTFLLQYYPKKNKFFTDRESHELYHTNDLKVHECAYEVGLYSHNKSHEHVQHDYEGRKFDMWSYAFENQDIPLLNWVMSKGYRKPDMIIYPCPLKVLSNEFLTWVWNIFYQKNAIRLLEMTLFENEAFIPSGDWAFHLYQKETGQNDEQTQIDRLYVYKKCYPWSRRELSHWECFF